MNQPMPSQSLKALLQKIGVVCEVQTPVTGLAVNSQEVTQGDVFIALAGQLNDGRAYVDSAIAQGAQAVLVDEQAPLPQPVAVPVVPVAKLREKLSALAGAFYDHPSAKLNLIGVTGTNGKSTCVHLLAQLAQALGRKAASIGTLGVLCEGESLADYAMTTPDAVVCQKVLAHLRAHKVSTVAMEVSSHGLVQHRVAALKFRAGIFTNLSHEHLDYHGSITAYAEAKSRLMQFAELQFAIINLDDPFAELMLAKVRSPTRAITYAQHNQAADVVVSELQFGELYTRFHLRSPWGSAYVMSALLGEFNVYNLTAAITTLCAQGASFTHVIALCEELEPVPGRMQRVRVASSRVQVVVDYAHTPDALAKALAAVRAHCPGKLWCVFGCGGDRDPSKRVPMAQAAAAADEIVVTSDNPRTEDPHKIIAEIVAGLDHQRVHLEADRARAITFAISQAAEGDVILLAGKGHETYQIIGSEKKPFSDIAHARSALQLRHTERGEAP